VVGERFPKTGVDVVVTVLEAEEDAWIGEEGAGWGSMSVLGAAVTVACVALVDAGIDMLDFVVGGVAAVVDAVGKEGGEGDVLEGGGMIVLDPNPVEHERVVAACVVGYVKSRDEMSLIWLKGAVSGADSEKLIDAAVKASLATRRVVEDIVRESTRLKLLQEVGK
jgi:exosome complex component MTR3